MNKNWDSEKFILAKSSEQIFAIHLSGYMNGKNEGDEEGRSPTNHWAAFLEHSKKHSVRLDMMPGYGSDGLKGMLEISSKPYVSTRNAIKIISFPTIGKPTVQNVIDVISRNGRDRYKFTEDYEGCRYWMYIFISDLEDAGIIDDGCGGTAWEALSKYWRSPSGSESRIIEKGVFH